MKKVLFVLLAGVLMVCNASAQSSSSKPPDGSQGNKPSSEPSSRRDSGTNASANTSASTSASASAQAGQNSANISAGTTFEAALSGSLDARKNKEGDQVTAHTTQAVKSDGQVVIPKGCKLIGHVTQAKARAKGESESALGIVFDKAVLKNGQEMPINVMIQALASAQTQTAAALDSSEGMAQTGTMGSAAGSGHAGGGVLSGAGSTVGSTAGAVTNTVGTVGNTAGGAVNTTASTATSATGAMTGATAAGQLTSSSSGVIGLKGLSLNSEASNATQGSLIVSSSRNVHLDSGTRMLLRAQTQ